MVIEKNNYKKYFLKKFAHLENLNSGVVEADASIKYYSQFPIYSKSWTEQRISNFGSLI